jgi:hypothetical protein
MHVRLLSALVAAIALLFLVGCADDGDPSDGQTTDGDEEAPAELELEGQPDLGEPVDLDEGVAAVVDGVEIADDDVEERFAAISAVPEVAEQLVDDEEGAAAGLYRARVLQNLILDRIVADGAEDLGVEPSDEDVASIEQQAIDEFDGDRDEWESWLDEQGITDEQREQEFRFIARVDAIRDEVADDVDEEELELGEELELAPADLALQQWFGERLDTADVQVDQRYGLWNPQSGEVIPLGVLEGSG